MKIRTLTISLAVATIAVVVLAVGFTTDFSKDSEVIFFPEKLEFRAEIREGEELRTVQYFKDGLTPMHAVAEHKDGKVSQYWYYETGKIREAQTHSEEIDSERHLLRHALIAEDGATYLSDTEYADNGLPWKITTLIDELTTERKIFFPGTEQLNHLQTLVKMRVGWVKTIDETFNPEGRLVSVLNVLEDGSTTTSNYNEDGKVEAVFSGNNYGTKYGERWLYPDGETIRREVDQDRSGTTLNLYREDGSLESTLHWSGPIDQGGVLIHTKFSADGKKTLKQSFMFRDGKYQPWVISIFREDGKDLRNIYYSNGSSVPTSDTLYDEDDPKARDRVLRDFDENGFLTKTKTFRANVSGVEEHFTPEDNIVIHVPDEYLVFPVYEAPKQVIAYSPPRGPHP